MDRENAFNKIIEKGKDVFLASQSPEMEVIPTGQGNGEYGLGINYMKGLGYGHSGAHVSFLTADYYNPDTGTTILLITNFWDLDEITAQGNGMNEFAVNAVNAVQ